MTIIKNKNEYNIKTPVRNIPLGGVTLKDGEDTDIKLVLFRDLTKQGKDFILSRTRRELNDLSVVGVVYGDDSKVLL